MSFHPASLEASAHNWWVEVCHSGRIPYEPSMSTLACTHETSQFIVDRWTRQTFSWEVMQWRSWISSCCIPGHGMANNFSLGPKRIPRVLCLGFWRMRQECQVVLFFKCIWHPSAIVSHAGWNLAWCTSWALLALSLYSILACEVESCKPLTTLLAPFNAKNPSSSLLRKSLEYIHVGWKLWQGQPLKFTMEIARKNCCAQSLITLQLCLSCYLFVGYMQHFVSDSCVRVKASYAHTHVSI